MLFQCWASVEDGGPTLKQLWVNTPRLLGDACSESRRWQVRSKKQNVSSPLTRKDSILLRASVTKRWRARPQAARTRILNSVSGGQCHLIHLTILRKFSWPGVAYYVHRWPKTPFMHLFIPIL